MKLKIEEKGQEFVDLDNVTFAIGNYETTDDDGSTFIVGHASNSEVIDHTRYLLQGVAEVMIERQADVKGFCYTMLQVIADTAADDGNFSLALSVLATLVDTFTGGELDTREYLTGIDKESYDRLRDAMYAYGLEKALEEAE